MFDSFGNTTTRGSILIIILSVLSILISGIFFGATYYIMDTVDDAFHASDCVISNNLYVDSCQDLWELSIYPFLGLRSILIWASFFFIFALALGMLVLGYKSGKSPVLMGLLILFVSVLTYVAIELSNVYRSMLQVDMFREMMLEFTVYNRVMMDFPWFIFIVTLLSVMLGVANYQRSKVNSSREVLDY